MYIIFHKSKKNLTGHKDIGSSTTSMSSINHMSSCKKDRRKWPVSANGKSKSRVRFSTQTDTNHLIQGRRRKFPNSGVRPPPHLAPPKKHKMYTSPQLTGRPKKRLHQARAVNKSTDSDNEKDGHSIVCTNAEKRRIK